MEKVLPKGWVETELGNYAFLKNGYAYKTTQFKETGIPILKISNITKDGKVDISNPQFVSEKDLNKSFLVKNGDIVIAMSGATTGKFGVYEQDELLLQNQRVGNIKLHFEELGNKKFLFYLIASLKKVIEDRAYGGAQPNISPTLIETINIPVPPLAEQERIVAKLDALFAQHELMKKALDRIPQLLKDFRQQVLTLAVTGKLTEQWREGKDLEEWKYWEISELGQLISGFAFKSSDFKEDGIQLIRMGNLYNNKLDLYRSPVFLAEDYESKIVDKYSTRRGDILLSLTGTKYKRDYGFAIEIDTDKKQLINQRILCIRPSINNKYLLYLLRDNIFRDYFFALETGGVNQGNVGVTSLAKISLNIPPLQEQQEIVHRVESLFAKADAIENRYQTLKGKIDSIPQALLHKAFKGELVPQLPTDGDAKDLLAEIMALKKEVKGKKKQK